MSFFDIPLKISMEYNIEGLVQMTFLCKWVIFRGVLPQIRLLGELLERVRNILEGNFQANQPGT